MRSGRPFHRSRAIATATVLLACASALVGCNDYPVPPTATPPPAAFAPVGITSVGSITQGTESAPVLVLQFTETERRTIAPGAGSIEVTLTDHAGLASVGFTGTPAVVAPGSLGATATLTSPNVLKLDIVDSDSFNVEQVTISGLGIRAPATAAVGAVSAMVTACLGSLSGCTPTRELASPGTVVTP